MQESQEVDTCQSRSALRTLAKIKTENIFQKSFSVRPKIKNHLCSPRWSLGLTSHGFHCDAWPVSEWLGEVTSLQNQQWKEAFLRISEVFFKVLDAFLRGFLSFSKVLVPFSGGNETQNGLRMWCILIDLFWSYGLPLLWATFSSHLKGLASASWVDW